ncbi:ferredoxin [Halieaceae bacterium]|nr:ferredoxin [Halieaceae bacterium]
MAKYRVCIDLQLCQGHGVCVDEAPEVFDNAEQEGSYTKVVLLQEYPPEALRGQVEDAAQWCPNKVISIIEEGS